MAFSIKTHKKQLQLAGVIFAGFAVLGVSFVIGSKYAAMPHGKGHEVAAKHSDEEERHDEGREEGGEHGAGHGGGHASDKSLWASLREGLIEFQHKVETLHRADEENGRLRLENANLRARLESLRFEKAQGGASSFTTETGLKLDKETGSRLGRTLASISYKPPGHLLPAQMHTLAVSYFKAREDEKAAVLLTFLTGLEDNDAYQNPRDLLLTGIAWYRLDNFEVADTYFDKVLKFAAAPVAKAKTGHGEEHEDSHGHRAPASAHGAAHDASGSTLQYQAHARIWKGLVAKRRGHGKKAQAWFREVLDHHPHSEEASWVNTGVSRHEGGGEE